MRTSDKLLEKELKKKEARPVFEEPEDMELTIEKTMPEPFNGSPNIFDESAQKQFSGINTERSVFDKKAVFNVKSGE